MHFSCLCSQAQGQHIRPSFDSMSELVLVLAGTRNEGGNWAWVMEQIHFIDVGVASVSLWSMAWQQGVLAWLQQQGSACGLVSKCWPAMSSVYELHAMHVCQVTAYCREYRVRCLRTRGFMKI